MGRGEHGRAGTSHLLGRGNRLGLGGHVDPRSGNYLALGALGGRVERMRWKPSGVWGRGGGGGLHNFIGTDRGMAFTSGTSYTQRFWMQAWIQGKHSSFFFTSLPFPFLHSPPLPSFHPPLPFPLLHSFPSPPLSFPSIPPLSIHTPSHLRGLLVAG